MDRLRLGSFNKADLMSRRSMSHVMPPSPVHENLESSSSPRCVIVQRDEKGYGLTVSGDNPVFVQEVKHGGAAAKAGVQEGDRIVKVNGTLVTQANHQEVVKLIKSGQYVALTLLGPSPNQAKTTHSPIHPFAQLSRGPSFIAGGLTPNQTRSQNQNRSQDRITGPQPPDAEQQAQCTNMTVVTIQKMLNLQKMQRDSLVAEVAKGTGTDKTKSDIENIQRTIDSLEKQLTQLRRTSKTTTTPPPGGTSSSRENTPTDPSQPQSAMRRQMSMNQTSKIASSASLENITSPSTPCATPPSISTPPSSHLMAKHQRQRSSPDSLIYRSPSEEGSVPGINQWSHSMADLGKSPLGEPAEGGAPNEAFEYDDDDGTPLLGSPKAMVGRPLPPIPAVPDSEELPPRIANFEHQDSTESESGLGMFALGPGISMYEEGTATAEPFLKSWKLLRQPVEVAMFLHYLLINQKNTTSLLFFVIVEQYKCGQFKDMCRWAYEITSTFLAPNGPLCIDQTLEDGVLQGIDTYMRYLDENQHLTESNLQGLFYQAKTIAMNHLKPMVDDFQRGLECKTVDYPTPDAGEAQSDYIKYWETTLLNLIKTLYPITDQVDSLPNVQSAMMSAMATVLKLTVVKSEAGVKVLEHIPTFVSKEKSKLKLFPQRSKKSLVTVSMGHSFQGTHYTRVTHCTVCQDILWGVGEQGLQCTSCEMNIHKQCLKNVEESCVGQDSAKKKPNRRSTTNMFRGHDNDSSTDLDKLAGGGGSSPHSTVTKPVVRSESFRQRRENRPSYRKRSDPNIPRSKSDVDAEDKPKLDKTMYRSDSDMDCDDDPPKWLDNVDFETQRLLKPKERKRQDVLNELFHTEKRHVRNLKILNIVYYQPCLAQNLLDQALLDKLFPNLNQLIQIHSELNEKMKIQRKQEPIIGNLGDTMMQFFTGDGGAKLEIAVASFCKNQQTALEELKVKQKKDPKLQQFLAEAAMRHECKKLHLKDIIASGFQRLTKYPLLLENVLKYTQPGPEYDMLNTAWDNSKKILANVNRTIGEIANKNRVLEVQRHLEVWPPKEKEACDDRFKDKDDKKSEGGEKKKSSVKKEIHPLFSDPSLSVHTLVHEGILEWKLNKQKSIEITALLFDDFMMLLQKQDEKYHLRYHHVTLSDENKITCPPVIDIPRTDIKTALAIRDVATNKRGFFLVALSQHNIYEFVAPTVNEKKLWLEKIQNMDKRANEEPKPIIPPVPTTPSEVPATTPEESNEDKPVIRRPEEDRVYQILEEEPLVDFSSAVTVEPPVTQMLETAQPVATLPAQLQRKDEEIKQLLNEKYMIVAKMMGLPDQMALQQMADIADNGPPHGSVRDPLELLVSVMQCTRELQNLLNESLKVTSPPHEEPNSPENQRNQCCQHTPTQPSIPAYKALKISHRLNQSLMALSQAVDLFDRKAGTYSNVSTLRLEDEEADGNGMQDNTVLTSVGKGEAPEPSAPPVQEEELYVNLPLDNPTGATGDSNNNLENRTPQANV